MLKLCTKTDAGRAARRKAVKKYIAKNREKHNLWTSISQQRHKEEYRPNKYKNTGKWKKQNPGYCKNYLDEWYKEHPGKQQEYRRNYQRKRRNNDPLFKFKCSVRHLIGDSFRRRGFKKDTKTEKILGLSCLEFRDYIISKFLPGMSFEDRPKWHLDHIIPLATAKTKEDIIRLCHFTNLQPLWREDHTKKHKKRVL